MIKHPSRQEYLDFGYKNVGPIIFQYCEILNSILESNNLQNYLFCARAGVRIARCLQLWLSANNIEPNYNIKIVPLSRIAALRLSRLDCSFDYDFIQEAMVLNTHLQGLDAVNKFLKSSYNLDEIPEGLSSFGEILYYLISNNLCDSFTDSLSQSRRDFTTLLQELSLNTRCTIVDSGWAGSTQLFLEKAYPDIQFSGVYFATDQKVQILGRSPGAMIGILHNAEFTLPFNSGSDIIHHRHFFESLFEPNISSYGFYSAEHYENLNASLAEEIDILSDWDYIFQGALNYIKEGGANSNHDKFVESCSFIMKEFVSPSSLKNVFCLGGKSRSHDMGREGHVEIFDLNDIQSKMNDKNYEFNLWPQGTAFIVKAMYNELDETLPFTLLSNTAEICKPSSVNQELPLISIITRTKNRPILLKRALESVALQNYNSIEHIIINDGGCPLAVENEILSAANLSTNIKVLHNESSIGMEAASNAGIKNSSGKYLLIHDDDDSLCPSFVSECVDYLLSNSHCDGVVTRSTYVSEQILGSTVKILGEYPYNDWLEYVMMSEMAVNNFFPPISFIFSRSIYDEIGGFNEALPVLGDWDFNLRFLALSDIGVIPKALAKYHHRDQDDSTTYSNSVIGGVDKHKKFRPVMINGLLRTNSERYAGLRACIANAYSHQELRSLTRK